MLNVPTRWRAPLSFADDSPWTDGERGRPLQILVDDATAKRGYALETLDELAGRLDAAVLHTDPKAQWRVEVADQPDVNGALAVRLVAPRGIRVGAIPASLGRDAYSRALAAERRVGVEDVLRLLRLDQVAHGFGADAIVTGLDMHRPTRPARAGLPEGFAGSSSACSLLGLYLRAHNDFTVRVDGRNSTFLEAESFYLTAAASALHAHSGWVRAAQLVWRQGSAELVRLLRGVEIRLARALRMRDYFAVRIRHWRPDDIWGECLMFFEAYLLFLDGAMDSAARFCDRAAGVLSHRGQLGWRTPWVDALRASDSRLADVLEPQGRLRSAAGAVGVLRKGPDWAARHSVPRGRRP